MRYVTVPIIWALVVLVNVVGFPVALLAVFVNRDYTERVMKAHNRAAAAVFGFSGAHGVSHECGKCVDCWFCKPLCAALSFLLQHDNHCEEEAK